MPIVRPIVSRNTSPLAYVVGYGIGIAGKFLAPIAGTPRIYHWIFWQIRKLMATLVDKQNFWCSVALRQDAIMRILIGDPYWNAILADSYEYEPEIHRILEAISHIEFTFVDCGANFGYWSILVSSSSFESRPTLAIEASPTTYTALTTNCALNHNRFACLHAAVSRTTGEIVSIDASGMHSGAHITRNSPTSAEVDHRVATITLDDAVKSHFGAAPERLVVKLDVEGEEINAMLGARELLGQDVLFVYEDHGADPTCKVTRFVLENLGMKVYFYRSDGSVIEIRTVAAAAELKTNRFHGYNFFACHRGKEFDAILSNMAAGECLDVLHRGVACRAAARVD